MWIRMYVPFKSMGDHFALRLYVVWERRNPKRALRVRRQREGKLTEQERWDDAEEEVLEAMMSASYGPAPPKYIAVKGL